MQLQQVEQANPGLRVLDLADYDQCMRVLDTKRTQIRVRSQYGITQYARSDLIGQYWTDLKYFHGRPSVTVNPTTLTPEPYAADNSTASNLGPTNGALVMSVQQRVADLKAEFKKENLPVPAGPVPVDLVTASGSGLDPDISPANSACLLSKFQSAASTGPASIR